MMKTIFTFVLLFVSLLSFSQEKKSASSGYITFNSGSSIYFKNLTIDEQNVKFHNETAQKEMIVSIGGVKKIVDSNGAVIYNAGPTQNAENISAAKEVLVARSKTEEEMLVYKSSSKIMMNQRKLSNPEIEALLKPAGLYSTYREGKNNAVLGKILMGGGIGLFIGGGISNLINANNTNYNGNADKKGSPALLIAGIAATAIGIPVKIGGNKKIKSAVNQYNNLPVNNGVTSLKPELKVIAGSAGVGLQINFK